MTDVDLGISSFRCVRGLDFGPSLCIFSFDEWN
jgi:hypothetical protein